MQAPDVAILYQFAENFSAAMAQILTADRIPASALREFAQLPKNNVACTAGGFRRASPQMGLTPLGIPFFNHFAGTLRAMVCTERANKDFAPLHGVWVGRVNYLLISREAQGFNLRTLPYYEVLRLELAGESEVEDEKTETDRTLVEIFVEFGVPGTSYPNAQR